MSTPACSALSNVLQYLRQRPTQNMYGRELVGDAIPHVLIARTPDERVDTSVIQLTNTLLPLGAGYALERFYTRLQRNVQPVKTLQAKQWSRLGKSFALFGFIAAIPIANAFIRNWVTAKRSGTVGFVDMVGEKDKRKNEALVQNKLKGYARNIGVILGTGAVLSLSAFAIAQLAIRGKWRFGKWHNRIDQFLGMPGGKFEQFPQPVKALFGKVALAPILFWGAPIYAGLFSASRDKFEFKELVLRFGTFLTSFFILPRLAKDVMTRWSPAFLKRLAGGPQNAAVLAELATTSVLFAILPPLVNIYLTHKRVAKEAPKPPQPAHYPISDMLQPTVHRMPMQGLSDSGVYPVPMPYWSVAQNNWSPYFAAESHDALHGVDHAHHQPLGAF